MLLYSSFLPPLQYNTGISKTTNLFVNGVFLLISFPHKIGTILGYFDFWLFVATAAWAAFLAFTISTNSCKEKRSMKLF
jgi:hypothetical protein